MFFSTLRAPLFALGAYAVGVLAVSAVSDATRDLSAAYDLAQSGAGDYSIKTSYPSIHLDTGGIPEDFYQNVEDDANVNLSRDLAVLNPEFAFYGCTERGQKQRILNAIAASRRYIAVAENYLAQRGAGGRTYKRWFGLGRLDDVRKVITDLKSYSLVGYTVDCHTCLSRRPYLELEPQNKIIILCRDFWNFYSAGQDMSQATFLIDALVRLPEYGDLQVILPGARNSKSLALRNPADAVKNLDNYMQFLVAVNKLSIVPNYQ